MHEWKYALENRPQIVANELGELSLDKEESTENLITWIFDEGSFVPSAKITQDDTYSIISDYIGKPIAAYNGVGNLVWDVEYDIYGNIRSQSKGDKDFIPFRNQGQYEDSELNGLMYNRFRYYDGNSGTYISQDPIGLAGGNPNIYAYVHDSNFWVDLLGLATVYLRNNETYVGKAIQNAQGRYGNKNTATDIFTGIPDTDTAQGVEQITYERMKQMEALGDLDPMTNTNKPVDMGNKNKTYRRDLGEEWLKATFGDDYEEIIDKKIKDHYQPRAMCK